jgi:hypothetical protein
MNPLQVRQCSAILHILYDDQTLERIVAGAVRATANAHGPLSARWNGSTTKRIASSIRATVKQQVTDQVAGASEEDLTEKLIVLQEAA